MRHVKIAIALMALLLSLGVSLRLCQAESHAEQLEKTFHALQEEVAYDMHTCYEIVQVNTRRQNYLEDVFLHSENYRLTTEYIYSYNSQMKTQLARGRISRKNTSMGGE